MLRAVSQPAPPSRSSNRQDAGNPLPEGMPNTFFHMAIRVHDVFSICHFLRPSNYSCKQMELVVHFISAMSALRSWDGPTQSCDGHSFKNLLQQQGRLH